VLPDAAAEMNASLSAALAVLQRRGVTRVAIVSADLPQLDAADVTALVQAGRVHGMSLAPDHTGQGTNAACLALPARFGFHFGPGSFLQHVAEARRLGMEPAHVTRDGLAFDIDEPADVLTLRARADARYAFLG
jgi:2-phospho-L-lactate guanylyltransferase